MTTIVTIAALFFVAAISATFLVSTQSAILLAYLTKPIIDASWASSIGGISALRVIGIILPIFVLGRVVSAKKKPKIPLITIWLAYVLYSAISFTLQIVFSPKSIDVNILDLLDSTFRVLNGFAGYLMVQCYFTERDHFRKLLICLLCAGLFPLFIGVFQAASGVTWHERYTVGLARNVGLYHDAFAVRSFVFQTLAAIFLYWSYFLDRFANVKRITLLVLIAVCLLVLYKTYSKGAVLILLVWLLIWGIGAKKIVPVIVIVLVILGANMLTKDTIQLQTQQLFSKEIAASEEGTDVRVQKRSLGGRWYIWEDFWTEYLNSSFIEQIFGSGKSVAAHNDFLARLISSGIIGLVIYCLLLLFTGISLAQNYLRNRSPLNVMALMVFAMWMIDAIGLVPSLYTSYQWFVWGFIGLALHGVEWDEKSRKSVSKPPLLISPMGVSPGNGLRRRNRRRAPLF